MSTLSHPESQAPTHDVGVGHEERDVHARPIALAVLGLAVIAAGAFLAMHFLFNVLAAGQSRDTAPPSPLAAQYGLKEAPEPRLQTAPLKDLLDLRARDAELLQSYAWVDRQAGTVRIPIARAIEVLAARGLPARAAADAPKGKP